MLRKCCLAIFFESLVKDGWSLHHCWQLNFIFSLSSKGSHQRSLKEKCMYVNKKCPTVAIQNVREKSKMSNFYQICIARDFMWVQTLLLGCCMLPACNERFQKLRNSSLWIEVNWFLTDSPQVEFCSESCLDWICQLINFLSTLKAAHTIFFLTTRYNNAYKYKCWGTFNRLVLVFVLNIFIKHKKMEYRNIGSVITKIAKVVWFRFGLKSVKLRWIECAYENSEVIMTRRFQEDDTENRLKQSSFLAAG